MTSLEQHSQEVVLRLILPTPLLFVGRLGAGSAGNIHLCLCVSVAGQTCVDIKDNVVDEGLYFTPKGDDPCLSCTCHGGEPEMCVAALCERPQGCQQYRKDPKECCKFMCLDPGETDAGSQVSFPIQSQRLHGPLLPQWQGLVRGESPQHMA